MQEMKQWIWLSKIDLSPERTRKFLEKYTIEDIWKRKNRNKKILYKRRNRKNKRQKIQAKSRARRKIFS